VLTTEADPGYDGAGIGIHIPVKHPAGGQDLDISTRARSALQRSLRCLGERGFALLGQRWRTLQHITASSQQNRRHHRRRPHPHSIRAWLHHMNFAEITSAVRWVRTFPAVPQRPLSPDEGAAIWRTRSSVYHTSEWPGNEAFALLEILEGTRSLTSAKWRRGS
jgi:hypothetical protein